MLGLQIFAQVDEVCITPTVQNVLNELDGVTKGFGVYRYSGEKGKAYKDSSARISKLAFQKPDEQHMLLGLELRSELEFAVFEHSDISNYLSKIDVLDSHKLRVVTFADGPGTSLYASSTSYYDLIDRSTYPFLEEVLGAVTQGNNGLRSYMSPLGHGRYNHVLPYHLAPVQRNYEFKSGPFQKGTAFYLNDQNIIPDSVEISTGNMPTDESERLKFVADSSKIIEDGDVYVNTRTGYVQTGSDFTKYNPFISYETVDPVYRFMTTPGSTIFSYASTDVATRINIYDNPNAELKKHRFQESAVGVVESYIYSNAGVSPKLSSMFSEEKLQSKNLNRWG